MNTFKVVIKNIQHIKSLEYEIDLSSNKLHCLVGKNGIGKTTLIKIIQNFKETNTLDKMSRVNIINDNSKLTYTIDSNDYKFDPFKDDSRFILDCNKAMDEVTKKEIYTEFPIPLGRRFSQYSRLGEYTDDVAAKFSSNTYEENPNELIAILNNIYQDNRFNNLKKVNVKSEDIYLIPLNDENYIREDDFSSGEYMLLQIYKLIKTGAKFIVIDELDISLDSSAQVNLIEQLRMLTGKYKVNILFTTHSLAIMKTMNDDELFYMETIGDETTVKNMSYSYIKSSLFKFEGNDKIILTEDKMIIDYLKTFLDSDNIFSKYSIIDIAGHSQTVDIMEKNKQVQFLGTNKILTILDGDQQNHTNYKNKTDIKFIPFESIEKDLLTAYELGELDIYIIGDIDKDDINRANGRGKKSKALYYSITQRGYMNFSSIITFLENKCPSNTLTFKNEVKSFLKS